MAVAATVPSGVCGVANILFHKAVETQVVRLLLVASRSGL
jgi:hypothetical protein